VSYSGLQLLSSSARLIGVLAEGESLSAQGANDALNSLNDLLDSWSNEGLIAFPLLRETFALATVGLQQTYTWGTGANLNSAWPMRVRKALIQLTGTSPPIELPMQMLNADEYAAVVLKTLQSNFPLYCYIDDAYPARNVNVWPVPTDSTNSLGFYSTKPLITIATLGQVLSVPPGYLRAIRYALAIELAPEYGKTAPQEVIAIAEQSKAAIKRNNTKPIYLTMDAALTGKSAVYNWKTDGYDR
jgi:hypothetical protein